MRASPGWLVVAVLSIAPALMGCGDEGGEAASGGDAGATQDSGIARDKAGLGNDRRAPTGTPFQPPAGLQIEGLLTGTENGFCAQDQSLPVGSGVLVRACLRVRNTTSSPIELELPAGLLLVAQSEQFQHGLLVERFAVPVPPTPGAPFQVPIYAYGLNRARARSSSTAQYAAGPITDQPDLRELVQLLEGKALAGDVEKVEAVQQVIWSVTEADGLTAADREILREL